MRFLILSRILGYLLFFGPIIPYPYSKYDLAFSLLVVGSPASARQDPTKAAHHGVSSEYDFPTALLKKLTITELWSLPFISLVSRYDIAILK